MTIHNLNTIRHQELVSIRTGDAYSKTAVLTTLFDFQDLFVHHEILAPGRKTSAPHKHTLKEEMVLVLNGLPTLHLGNEVFQLKSGDFVGFKPGAPELHYIENNTNEMVTLLVICSKPKDDLTTYS